MLSEKKIAQAVRDSPAAFNQHILGRHPYWDKQLEICKAIRQKKKTILVPSGNATGKSWCVAGLVLWYLTAHPKGVVVTTAPTYDQLANVLWRAIFNAYERRNCDFLSSPRITRQPLLIEKSKDSYAIGISTSTVEGASGHHAENLLVIIDEASGVEDDRISALNSLNPSLVIMIGNPLVSSGVFYERCIRQELDPDKDTALVRIRSSDTPPAKSGIQRSPTGLADLDFLDRSRRDYGEGSPWWLSHVEARFPDSAEGQLFDRTWIDRCIYAPVPDRNYAPACGPLVMAVDIAAGRGGDTSTIMIRDDMGIIELESSNHTPIEEWAQKAAGMAQRYGIPPFRVIYDATGMGETFDALMANYGFKGAVGFQGGHGTNAKYENLRSATYWALRRRLNPSVTPETFHIPAHIGTRLRKELQATTYSLTAKDKIAIAKKDDIISKIGHSPDFADTLMMSFALVNC